MQRRSVIRIEIDGSPATVEAMWLAGAGGYGHFTAMQVRGRKVRGLDLHLARLEEGTRALFRTCLEGDRVRDLIRHALADDIHDASVRVNVFDAAADADVSVMVTVREPVSMPSDPQSLQTVTYQRPLAHIKHVGGFGQAYYGRLAKENGTRSCGPTRPLCTGSRCRSWNGN
jgi:branched-subunit amino acid aminotransferase/4-amino-4-deoxychorismate lyase